MAVQLPNINPSSKDYMAALQQGSNPKATAPQQSLGQADFLRLLTTQLKNQDPNQPMDPTKFVTDLTQMSQLQATESMNKSVQSMTKGFQSLQTLQAASLIGKAVQSIGDQLSHTQGDPSQFRLKLDQPLKDVKVVVTNDNGPVTELSMGDLNTGEKTVSWDGTDEQGNAMPSGEYTLTVYGTDENGALQSIKTVVPSRVNSVGVNDDGSMTLTLATGERVSLSDVREITQ
ncbi:flagellar hook assembly protein FlgD [Galenea microaerophila]